MDTNVLRRALWVFLRPLIQLITNLLSPEVGEEWLGELKKFLRKEPCWIKSIENPYLRRVPEAQGLRIRATPGQRLIANAARALFPFWIDPELMNWKLDHVRATQESLVDVWEIIQDATFSQFFEGFGKHLDQLVWENQDQIIIFYEDHRQHLRTDGYGTFFLLNRNDEYVVVDMRCGVGRLEPYMHRLSSANIWCADDQFRVVIPQPTL